MVQTARKKPNLSEERFLYCLSTVKNLMEDLPPPPPPAEEASQTKKGKGEGQP
jgi:hypothetical protein